MKIIECPRDAMQGLPNFIETEDKISYINALLQVGFYALDCGSFVSPRAIPQMRDTSAVLSAIDTTNSNTLLSVIIASHRGAKLAMEEEKVDILGYPFSISETFQQRNTNRSRAKAIETITMISDDLQNSDKELLIYYSMAFGNPYEDKWSMDEIVEFTEKFANMGVRTINLSDTIGVADTSMLEMLFTTLPKEFPEIEFGAHLHTLPEESKSKIQLVYDLGCRRFDTAIKGFGGCPMAKNDLVGNMPTEKLLNFIEENYIPHTLNIPAFENAYNKTIEILG